MMRNGWMFDLDYTNGEDGNEKNEKSCKLDKFYGYKGGNKVGSVSTIFKGSGKANLRYQNCYKTGYVTVSLNGVEIDRTSNIDSTLVLSKEIVTFQYEKGDLLEIKEFLTAIIKLHNFDLIDNGNLLL